MLVLLGVWKQFSKGELTKGGGCLKSIGWVGGGSVKFIKTLAINPVFQGKLVISQEPHNPLGTDAIGHVNLEHFTRRKDI